MHRRLKSVFTLVCTLWTTGLGLSENNQLLQTIAQALQRRESFFARCSIAWDAQIEVIDYPMENPEAFLKALEKWDSQRPDVEITPEAKGEFLQRAQRTHRCRYQTTIVVRRNGPRTSVQSEEGGACVDGHIDKMARYILYDDNEGYSIVYGAAVMGGSSGDAPEMWIFSHSSPVPLNSISGTQFLYPSDWVFLASFSVLKIRGADRKGAWRVIKQTDSEVVLEAEIGGGAAYSNPRLLRAGLSRRHGYAPSWVEEYSPAKITMDNKVHYQSFPVISIKVLEWKRVGNFGCLNDGSASDNLVNRLARI